MLIERRGLILGGLSMLVAPAIVQASSLMPLRGYQLDPLMVVFESAGQAWLSYKHYTDRQAWDSLARGETASCYYRARLSELGLDPVSLAGKPLGGIYVPLRERQSNAD